MPLPTPTSTATATPLLLALLVAACGPAPLPAGSPGLATSISLPSPSRSIQLRVAFDKDPWVYVGRFIPDAARPEEIDENSAVVTRCTKFIKPRAVDAEQQMDETMYVSRSASASLGLPMVGAVDAALASKSRVRVKYSLVRKIQSDIDADGLARCCKADPSQCTGRVIGEFLMGTGEVLLSTKESDRAGVDVTAVRPVTASADYRSDDGWKKKTSFKDVYFAFLTQATPTAVTTAASAPGDCSWCDTLPGSLDGKYFCGVSPDGPDEAASRALAMRAAREQVVQYLGQSISVKSTTTSNALARALEDRQVVEAAASGVASQVKDEKWCNVRVPTPDGEKVRSKVLAFYPKGAEDDGRKALADAAVASARKAGQLSPADQKSLREAITTGR